MSDLPSEFLRIVKAFGDIQDAFDTVVRTPFFSEVIRSYVASLVVSDHLSTDEAAAIVTSLNTASAWVPRGGDFIVVEGSPSRGWSLDIPLDYISHFESPLLDVAEGEAS